MYERNTSDAYPHQIVQTSQYVVAETNKGKFKWGEEREIESFGEQKFSYKYYNAVINLRGRGWLGFNEIDES